MVRRLEKAGFVDYGAARRLSRRAWDPRADVWVILARRAETQTSRAG